MNTKVSVIVPIYNCAQYIGKCVDSLMNQTLDEIEVIFIDDHSKDDSYNELLKSLAQYPERAKNAIVKQHEENKGVSRTRNEGIDLASGEFIAFCDSDDWMDKRMYEKMYQTAKAESAEIVICDFYFTDGNKKTLHHNQIDTRGG